MGSKAREGAKAMSLAFVLLDLQTCRIVFRLPYHRNSQGKPSFHADFPQRSPAKRSEFLSVSLTREARVVTLTMFPLDRAAAASSWNQSLFSQCGNNR